MNAFGLSGGVGRLQLLLLLLRLEDGWLASLLLPCGSVCEATHFDLSLLNRPEA